MKINNITIQCCVAIKNYQFKSDDLKQHLILDINRKKKCICVYLENCMIGFISRKDTPYMMSTLSKIRKYRTVSEWKLIKETKHYLILELSIKQNDKYKYFIYQLSIGNGNVIENNDDTYIGSTNNYIKRINNHIFKLKNKKHKNYKLYD